MRRLLVPTGFFYIKVSDESMSHAGSLKKYFYFHSFEGAPDKILFNQLPKSIERIPWNWISMFSEMYTCMILYTHGKVLQNDEFFNY